MSLFGYELTTFDYVVTFAFVAQILNYTWFGYIRRHNLPMSNKHAALATLALIGFSITEGTIALEDERISMWLYVLLNIYGVFHLWYWLVRKRHEKETVDIDEDLHVG